MSSKESFPDRSILASYVYIENMLRKMLEIIPYCKDHEAVWSPRLATILHETCSVLDSLWKCQAKQSSCVKKDRLSMPDYFQYYGQYVAPRWIVFWGEEPQKMYPYDGWAKAGKYKRDDYSELDWWTAYNKLKHDRFSNRSIATLDHAVRALAALFLAIIRCDGCRNGVAEVGWLSSAPCVAHNPQAALGEDSPSVKDGYVAAESRLFSYPVGWCNEIVRPSDKWLGNASLRFRQWFDAYRGDL